MKRIRYFTILLLLCATLLSCWYTTGDYAFRWSANIRSRILSDANKPFNRSVYDSSRNTLTLFQDGIKRKEFYLRLPAPKPDGSTAPPDTLVSVFYSTDQRFELVRELCPAVERAFQGIRYTGLGYVGYAEFRFCNGFLMKKGFRYANKDVGVWTTYDSLGNVIEQKNMGNADLLNKLQDIGY